MFGQMMDERLAFDAVYSGLHNGDNRTRHEAEGMGQHLLTRAAWPHRWPPTMIHGRSARLAAAAFKSASSHASWLPKPPARSQKTKAEVRVVSAAIAIAQRGCKRTGFEDGVHAFWGVIVVRLRVNADEVSGAVVEGLPHVGARATLLCRHAEPRVVAGESQTCSHGTREVCWRGAREQLANHKRTR